MNTPMKSMIGIPNHNFRNTHLLPSRDNRSYQKSSLNRSGLFTSIQNRYHPNGHVTKMNMNQHKPVIPKQKYTFSCNDTDKMTTSLTLMGNQLKKKTNYHSGFNMNTALELAKLCLLSYEEPHHIQNALSKENFKSFHYIGVNDPWPKAIIASNDQYISVCFRGTKSSWDWLSNLEFMQVQVPYVADGKGKVHKGIYRATMRRYDEILTVLRHMQEQKLRPVYLTGHSLGGGMAIISAARMNYEHFPPDAIYTFGSPKIGDISFAEEYACQSKINENTFRIVNYCDVVPKLPHTENFVHVSKEQERVFTQTGKLSVGGSFEQGNHDVINAIQEYGLACSTNFEIVNSHWMEAYIKNIEAYLKEKKIDQYSIVEKFSRSVRKISGLERE